MILINLIVTGLVVTLWVYISNVACSKPHRKAYCIFLSGSMRKYFYWKETIIIRNYLLFDNYEKLFSFGKFVFFG